MKKIKSFFRSIYQREDFPLIIFSVVCFLFYLCLPVSYDDRVQIPKCTGLSLKGYWDLMVFDYFKWSSRVIVNGVMYFMLGHNGVLWKFLTAAILFFLMKFLSRIMDFPDRRKGYLIIIAMFLLVPWEYLGGAGWGACTITYLWPIALGTLSFTTVYKAMNGLPVKWWEYMLCTVILLFSTNQEQMGAVLLAANGIIFLYFLFTHRLKFVYFWNSLIAASGTLFNLTVPGNALRSEVEAAARFPDWDMVSMLDKLDLGYSLSMDKLLTGKGSVLFPLLALFLMIGIWIKYKDRLYRGISAVPFAYFVLFGLLGNVTVNIFDHFPAGNTIDKFGAVNTQNAFHMSGYMQLILYSVAGACFLLSFYVLIKDTLAGIGMMLLMLAAIAVRIVIGFSPTVYASGDRTYLVTYYVLFFAALLIYKKVIIHLPDKWLFYLDRALYILAGFTMLNFVCGIML